MKPLKTAAQIATERPADPAPASLTEKEQLLKALTEARKQLAELQEKKRAVVAQFAASIAGTWKVGDTIHNESVDELNLQINAVKYDEGQIVQVLNERYPLPAVTTPAPEIDSVAWFARKPRPLRARAFRSTRFAAPCAPCSRSQPMLAPTRLERRPAG
jgi:hypothetical protein